MAQSFAQNRPLDFDLDLLNYGQYLNAPVLLLHGLPFSLTLLLILLAHEFGHYFACLYHRVDASLPFFIPFPSIIGTLGAFIRIRSPIYSRKSLFDIGVAGPLAGFAFLGPALAIGLSLSKVIPGIAIRGDFVFGTPALIHLFQLAIFPHVSPNDIYLHPVARAAWAGLLATALNLLPIGQLDGGHILYSLVGERHKLLSRIFVVALIPMARFYLPWLLWAAVLYFFALRHPMIYDSTGIGPARRWLAFAAFVIFLLSFSVAPISTNN